MDLLFHGQTDTGRVRKRNEDSITLESDIRLFVVADGMGGYGGGDVASRMACESIVRSLRADYSVVQDYQNEIMGPTPQGGKAVEARQAVMTLFADSIVRADMAIQAAAAEDAAKGSEELLGMGSTVVMALVVQDRAFIGHVGDSRAYLIRQSVPVRLTNDHSLLQGLVDSGMISHADVARFPMKNVLTRALGVPGTVAPDVMDMTLQDGDRILMCSDGLYGMVRDDIIGRLGANGELDKCSSKLIAYANAAGGTDNISVIILQAARKLKDADSDPAASRNFPAPADKLLRERTIFRGLHLAEWLRLYSNSTRLFFEDGDPIFSAGQLGDGMYCVLDGAVDVTRDGRSVHVFPWGTCLSEMSLTEEKVRLVSAVAKGPTTVMQISRMEFMAMCDRYPATGIRLLRQLQMQTAAGLRDTRDELNIMKVFMARNLGGK